MGPQSSESLKTPAHPVEMGLVGRRLVEAKYGWNSLVQSLVDTYWECIQTSGNLDGEGRA